MDVGTRNRHVRVSGLKTDMLHLVCHIEGRAMLAALVAL